MQLAYYYSSEIISKLKQKLYMFNNKKSVYIIISGVTRTIKIIGVYLFIPLELF